MLQEISADEYERLHTIAINIIRRKFPHNVGIDEHDLAHESLEFFYSMPNRSSLWLSIVDALRRKHGGQKNAGYLDEIHRTDKPFTDPAFDEFENHRSLMSLYRCKENSLTDNEKFVFFATIEGRTTAELGREEKYTESYYSYLKKDLIGKLRSGLNQTTR